MNAMLVNSRGNHVATIELANGTETPRGITYNKQMYFLAGDVPLGFIFKAESFMVIFDDTSEVTYDAAGRKAITKDKYGNVKIKHFQIKQADAEHPVPL